WEFASTRDGFDSPTRKLDRELLANAVPPELPLVDIQNDRGRADFRALLNCRPIPRCLARRLSWICVLTGRWSRILPYRKMERDAAGRRPRHSQVRSIGGQADGRRNVAHYKTPPFGRCNLRG